jgi:esterase/lipase superfamily enzyme
MERETWTWKSPALNREMTVARWGYFGKPVILFPTAAADCLDYERFKMIWKLKPMINAGRIKVYSCESVNGDSWCNKEALPAYKAKLQAHFDHYVSEELLPLIENDCEGFKGYVAAGASLGAYNAVHAALRNPEHFDLCIAMSGTYDFDRWMDSHRDKNYYFTQPMYYAGSIPEGRQLSTLRDSRFVVATGSGRYEAPDESRRMAGLLEGKGIPTRLEVWGEDAHHDWPTWRSMLPLFLDRFV